MFLRISCFIFCVLAQAFISGQVLAFRDKKGRTSLAKGTQKGSDTGGTSVGILTKTGFLMYVLLVVFHQ